MQFTMTSQCQRHDDGYFASPMSTYKADAQLNNIDPCRTLHTTTSGEKTSLRMRTVDIALVVRVVIVITLLYCPILDLVDLSSLTFLLCKLAYRI